MNDIPKKRMFWRELKRRVKAFFSWLFVTMLFAFLNGWAFSSFRDFYWMSKFINCGNARSEINDIFANLVSIALATSFDSLLFIGFCRGSVLPQVTVELSKAKVEPGDRVGVSYRIMGAKGWINKVRAVFSCEEIDDDIKITPLFRETVLNTQDATDLVNGTFSVTVPTGFPETGFNEKEKTVIMWSVEIMGRTIYRLLPNIKGFAEVEVRGPLS